MNEAPIAGRLVISGAFECKDKDGNVLKVIHLNGSVPLDEKQVEDILKEENGLDNRE